MKIILILLFTCLTLGLAAERYSIHHQSDKDRNFVLSVIKNEQGDVIGHFALVDPKPFYFYSLESDPDLFPYIDNHVEALAARKNRGRPAAMIVVDFSNQQKIRRPFNLKYLVNYFILISVAPPYLRSVEILNPNKFSRLFFIETKVAGKNYFGAMSLNRTFDTNGAKKFIGQIPGAGELSTIVPVLENVPVKLVSFEGGERSVLYESHRGHQRYTCVFLAGDK